MSDDLKDIIKDAHDAMLSYQEQLKNETDEDKKKLIRDEIEGIKSRLRKIVDIFDRIISNEQH